MKSIILLIVVCVFISCTNKDVLQTIETYKVPNESTNIVETYDHRLKGSKPLPKKLTDVLVYDVWLIMTRTLQIKGISYSNVTKEQVLKGLEVYRNQDWKKVIGFRPYTHCSFVKSFNSSDLEVLAENIVEHIRTFGVWEKPMQVDSSLNDIQFNVSDTLPSN